MGGFFRRGVARRRGRVFDVDWLVKYKGVDWLGMMFAMLSLFYLGKHRKRGFVLGLLCNVCWMVFGVMTESAGNIVANLAYAVFNIRGWRQWEKDNDHCPKEAKA